MHTYSGIVAIGLVATPALTAGFFGYLYLVKRQPYLLAWTASWSLLTLHYLCVLLEVGRSSPLWLAMLDAWLLATTALMFLYAARVYAHARLSKPLYLAGAVLFLAWTVVYSLGKLEISPYWGITAVLLTIAWVFWKEGTRQETYADKLLGLAFLFWAPTPILSFHFVAPAAATARTSFDVLARVPQLFAAVVMVMAIYEEEKRRVERNMLALSNLNLTTLNFIGSEIEKALSQALERVLSVVRLPAGAIFLRHNEAHGPEAAVSVGLDYSFCRTAQEGRCDEKLVRLVARLGGLLVIRDLECDSSWTSLERDEAFLSLRQLALRHGLRTVVGISLQAKDQTFGVLLLGSRESRRLAPAELRLLMALSQQIGMAVENSYLVQQSWRRSEELHVLNEIGRALSSMLDPDALFEKIFTEVQRLFDVSNFYIALYEASNEQIRFELEVTEGVRLPKRSRPLGNHLTEYILRSRQPVLIRENYDEEARKLGAEPLRQEGSYCGVPLIVYERTIGVMAVRGVQEKLFDEGHLEMMRVLASQASIAIENARLFREEQTKSRHLTLLNNISRNAIATLNPDEMLANIAEQLEEGLTFDHIGIGLLDYENKEVVVQAESGSRRGALGRRLPLGQSLVGRVARTGKMSVAHESTGGGGPVLESSASAIALPIVYADQLHGVLYVETAQETDFTEEEVLLLYTLADLIAGALHNALTFQRAQEQAITDGLTGVKTHRFFMEALSAEWKRSTRASRPFSLVLIDLDRFKLVNDFYGHLEGDLVLKRVGHILEETCRRSDVIARYGGDEFVILMPETDVEQCHQLSQKLRSRLAGDPSLREKRITGSFGIATFPVHGSTPQELIQVADASMYLSKHQGGNAVSTADRYDPNEAKKWKRNVLEAYLGVALTRMFSTGPAAFEEIRGRIEQLANSVALPDPKPAVTGQDAPAPNQTNDAQTETSAVDIVTSLALAVDSLDHYTQGHSQKVAAYAALIAEELGLEHEEVEEIRLAAMLHDIGKVGIPESILNKKGPLSTDERETMKAHAQYGEQILLPLNTMSRIRGMICHHHEMYDGSGYPGGLAGEQIPLGARIIAIADAYDTITTDRKYQKARHSSLAVAELERCSGLQFDPQLVQVFVAAIGELPEQLVEAAAPPSHEATL